MSGVVGIKLILWILVILRGVYGVMGSEGGVGLHELCIATQHNT